MAQKMTGALVFDERTDRYDIRFDLNSYYGGLHCGECFDAVSYTHLDVYKRQGQENASPNASADSPQGEKHWNGSRSFNSRMPEIWT